MGEIEHLPVQPKEGRGRDDKPSEKVGEDLPEGDFDIPMEHARESAREDSSGFTQAQQFIQAIRGEEQKQHKKEEQLATLLRSYIQGVGSDALFTTLLQILDRNVLATILVAALTLRDKELTGKIVAQMPGALPVAAPQALDNVATSQELQRQFGKMPWDSTVKPEIEAWLFMLREVCATYPKRLLKDISHENRGADVLFQQLLSLIMLDFFGQRSIPADERSIQRFSEAIVQRLIDQMIEQVAQQKLVR